MNVCVELYGNPCNWCWDISVCKSDGSTDQQSSFTACVAKNIWPYDVFLGRIIDQQQFVVWK